MAIGGPAYLALLVLGGLGPAIGAVIAVRTTPGAGPAAEFQARLLRWRVRGRWYLAAFGLPIAVAALATALGALLDPGYAGEIRLQPWYRFVPLFFVMVLGGGLEEVGWRGLAQPELERRWRRPAAALAVGLIWAAWHLPLFWLPGVGQFGTSFPVFGIGVVGGAGALAWLQGRTASVPLCIVFHATWNAIAEMGLALPTHGRLALLDSALRLALGGVLLAVGRGRPARPATTSALIT